MVYYFLVRLMAATGVRVSELVNLSGRDVHCGFKDLYSKGDKMRRIYIPSNLLKSLFKWDDFTARTDGALFLKPALELLLLPSWHTLAVENLCRTVWIGSGGNVPPLFPPPVRQKLY